VFQGKRYVTRGVIAKVPIGVQGFLWSLVDNLAARHEVEINYLQVFELGQAENGSQQIIHKQEVPEYHAVYQFDKVENPLNVKLYAIDDGCYCTMLLPSER
jgi:hypothetical protein